MNRASGLRSIADTIRRRVACATAAALLACIVLAGCASEEITSRPTETRVTPFRLISEWKNVVRRPQRDHYHVRWGFLKLGEITFDYRESRGGPVGEWVVSCATAPTEWAAALSSFGGFATTWIDTETMLPRLYSWNDLDRKRPTRRFDEFSAADGTADGVEIAPWGRRAETFTIDKVQDPVSVLVLVRVVLPSPGEPLRFAMIEGVQKRLATLTFVGREDLKISYENIRPALRFTLRVDPLEDDRLTDAEPDSDVTLWISDDAERRFLRTEGAIRGNGVTISWVPEESDVPTEAAPASKPTP